jgi:hypothetical protein
MLKHFRSSPLWLIGLLIIFAQATASIAAIQIKGELQAALVYFVIIYASTVTVIFFLFLLFKPENFYAPYEYEKVSVLSYVKGIKGKIPKETADAVDRVSKNPSDKNATYNLMDNLIPEEIKQHLVLMQKLDKELDMKHIDKNGHTHSYELITRQKGVSVGRFSPVKFISKLEGTGLVELNAHKQKIFLTKDGKSFAKWLIKNERDAETFQSDIGRWGPEQNTKDIMKQFFNRETKKSQ